MTSIVWLAFGFLDPAIARVCLGRSASEPFVRRRIGHTNFAAAVRRISTANTSGWVISDPADADSFAAGIGPKKNRMSIMHIHGGGFTLGDPTFYLEWLYRLRTQLAKAHPSLKNCVLYAPEYPLAPEKRYPAQSLAVEKAWQWLSNHAAVDKSRMVLIGDSAGGGLAVALNSAAAKGTADLVRPLQAVLMSPWTDLSLNMSSNPDLIAHSRWDYVEPNALMQFGRLLTEGSEAKRLPGFLRYAGYLCTAFWPGLRTQHIEKALRAEGRFTLPAAKSMPTRGTLIMFGDKEVLANQAESLAKGRESTVVLWRRMGALHAWPVSDYFLGRDEIERRDGIAGIVSFIVRACYD